MRDSLTPLRRRLRLAPRRAGEPIRAPSRRPFARALMTAAVLGSLSASGCRSMWNRGVSEAKITKAQQLSQQGLAAMDQGDWNGAQSLLAEALEEAPTDWQARAYYAEALWRQGANQQAIAQLAALPNLNAPDAASAVRVGGLLLEMQEPELAGRLADLALDMNPQLSTAWSLRGRAWASLGKRDRALADLNRALDYDANNVSVLRDVAELHRADNQPERALATLQHWINLYSPGEEPQEALYLQGLAYSALQRPGDAVDSLKAAADHGPPSPQLLYELAQALAQAGDDEAARRTLRQSLDLDAGHRPSIALLEQLERRDARAGGTFFR